MKKILLSAAASLMLCTTLFPVALRAADNVTIYGINPSGGNQGSWIESFNITIDPIKKTATAMEISACPDTNKLKAGGGILVVRSDIYYSLHSFDSNVRLNGNPKVLFSAKAVSGYDGFGMGLGDISGDDTHLWINPWDKSGKVFEFVPDNKIALGWKVAAKFDLKNAANKYDGMEVFGTRLFANQADASFAVTGATPCAKSKNAIYDEYDATNGNLVTAGLIKPTFPASGIAFDGTYFFVSDICNNKIAVYDKNAALIAEADLGALPAKPIACQDPGKSFCLNPNLTRCIEDLSTVVSPQGSTDNPSEQDPLTTASRAKFVPTLELFGTAPTAVRPGETRLLTMNVRANGIGVPGAPITFTSVLGDVRFVNGQLSQDGRQSTLSADGSGQATVQFVAGQPGLSIIEVRSAGATQRIAISASNLGVPEPQ
jgi:hypothetical protein